jgi:hypothetical protein
MRGIVLILLASCTGAQDRTTSMPVDHENPPIPDPVYGHAPVLLRQLFVKPGADLWIHGHSDCHLGAGADVTCTPGGNVDVELLGADRGPVVSAVSEKDVEQRSPDHTRLYRAALCHSFYVHIRARAPVSCDALVHAVVYPD